MALPRCSPAEGSSSFSSPDASYIDPLTAFYLVLIWSTSGMHGGYFGQGHRLSGLALLRHLADKTGLTGGLARALATRRILVHDRGRVLADLACAIADGARVISDFRVMSDQRELFGLVASVPTAWRTLKEIARGGTRADRRITAAVDTARRHAWAQVAARHGTLPGVRLADKTLEGVTCIRLDATVTFAHSPALGTRP